MRKLRVFMGLLLITLLTQSCASDQSFGRSELKNTGEADIHAVSDAPCSHHTGSAEATGGIQIQKK